MAILFNDASIRPRIDKKGLLQKTSKIIGRGIFLQGKENKILKKSLQKILKKGFVTLTASGHDALYLTLKSLQLKKDDQVIFPANVYPAVFPIAQSGVKMVPCDVDQNGLINIEKLRQRITKHTKVILVVHLYGLVVNIDKLKTILKKRKIMIIEDCAQAFGSTYKGKPVGTLGHTSCFSFYPTKNLGTLGDGGAVWTKHKKIHTYFTRAVTYGEGEKYKSKFIAGHSRLPEIQAGVLNLHLKNFKKEIALRRKVFTLYLKFFFQFGLNDKIRLLYHNQNSTPDLHLFVIEVKKRDKLKKYLEKKKIPSAIHYPYPIHLIPAFKHLGYRKGDFPVAERLSQHILSIPFHAFLTSPQIKFIVKSIRDFYYD